MPFRMAHPVLMVEESRLRNIDPQDPESLFGMWSAFHKCVGVLENGRRLENLSWRVFAHETICISKKRQTPPKPYLQYQPPLQHRTHPHLSQNLPALSHSLESQSSVETGIDDVDDNLEHPSAPGASFSYTLERSRTRDKQHITPLDLQNLVHSINQKQDITGPLSPLPPLLLANEETVEDKQSVDDALLRDQDSDAMRAGSFSQQSGSVAESIPTPRPSSPRPVQSSTSIIATRVTSPDFISPSDASETSVDSDGAHPVVRGFKAGLRGASSYRSQSSLHLASQPSQSFTRPSEDQTLLPRMKGGMFTLGGSLTEDEASVRDNLSPQSTESTAIGNASLRSNPPPRKHASLVERVTEIPKKRFMLSTSAEEGAAIESDDEDDYDTEEDISGSAIDDDEDEWEDEAETEDNLGRNLTFARVESKANLVSRRSVITQGLHETQRATALQSAAARSAPMMRRSRTSTPNGPSVPVSPEDQSEIELGSVNSSSRPIGLPAFNIPTSAQPPLSPRATRRNMLTSELGVSLRKHMLNERQTRNGPYNAAQAAQALQRRHTSNNVAGLTEYPGAPADTKSRNNSWNEYYDHGLGEYHQTGW